MGIKIRYTYPIYIYIVWDVLLYWLYWAYWLPSEGDGSHHYPLKISVSTIGRASVRLARNTPNFFLNMFFILNFWEYFLFDPKNFIISFYSNLLKGISFSFFTKFFWSPKMFRAQSSNLQVCNNGKVMFVIVMCIIYYMTRVIFLLIVRVKFFSKIN